MQLRQVLSQLVITSLIHHSLAAPEPLPTYSVVDVDGGSSGQHTGAGQAATTIYKTVTAPLSQTTVTQTITASPNTVTATFTATVTQYVDHSILVSPSVAPTQSSTTQKVETTIAPSFVTSATTITETTVSTIEAAFSTSTAYYDNGLWHTSYPVKSWSTSYTSRSALEPTSTNEAVLPSITTTLQSSNPSSTATYQRRQGKRARRST